jgi:hypothetical protein
MFRTVRLSIIRSLFTVHSAMVYVIQVCRQDGTAVPSWSCLTAVYKPVRQIPLLSVQWINSWWWTDELSETCRVSWQNKFVKFVHIVGLITNKFVMMHGHVNVKIEYILCTASVLLFQTLNTPVFVKLNNFCTMYYHIKFRNLQLLSSFSVSLVLGIHSSVLSLSFMAENC